MRAVEQFLFATVAMALVSAITVVLASLGLQRDWAAVVAVVLSVAVLLQASARYRMLSLASALVLLWFALLLAWLYGLLQIAGERFS